MHAEPTEVSMKLPPDKTCADCFHLRRCTWLISVNPSNVECDWAPSRFREASTLASK